MPDTAKVADGWYQEIATSAYRGLLAMTEYFEKRDGDFDGDRMEKSSKTVKNLDYRGRL